MQKDVYKRQVGNDRRDWGCPFACIAKLVGKECTDKCGNASENDVNRNRTAKKIGNDTSHEPVSYTHLGRKCSCTIAETRI